MLNPRIFSSLGILFFCLLLWAVNPAMGQDDFDLPASGSEESAEAGEASPSAEDAPADAAPEASAGATGGSLIDPSLDEVDQTDVLANNFKFKPPKQKDPFRPLVQKKVVLPPVVQRPTKATGPSAPPPPPPPKPIQLFVSGIVGNEGERLAIVNFENKIHTLTKDMDIDGKFKVVDVLPDRVVIYSNKEQMRRTFAIGGGKE